MQIKITTTILAVALAPFVALLLGARIAPASRTSVALANRLSGKTWQADQSPLSALWARHGKLADVLMREAKSSHVATRSSAMYLLGLYRIARAVPILAASIQFRHTFPISAFPVRGTSTYPAMQALIRIGSPAIPAMVKNLETTAKPDVAACSAWVIRKVEGPRLGACVIKLALRSAAASPEKARLRVALVVIASKSWRWDAWSSIKLPADIKWPASGSGK